MSNHYPTIYKIHTGEIVSTGFFACDDDLVDINFAFRLDMVGPSTHDIIDSPCDMDTQYVVMTINGASIVQRPSLRLKISKTTLIANGEDSIIIRGLPSPCNVTFDKGQPEEETTKITGGSFSFLSENPGRYKIYIDAFPFLPYEVEVIAT